MGWGLCSLPVSCLAWGDPVPASTASRVSEVKLAQLCPTLCNPMDYTVHRILQARILEWVAFPFSRGSSQPRKRTQVSCIEGEFFTSWATREAHTGSTGGLLVTSKRTYQRCSARTAVASESGPVVGHCQPTPLQEDPQTLTGRSSSAPCGVTFPFPLVLVEQDLVCAY